MCGITGVLNLSSGVPVDAERLRESNDAITHRGPDDDGMFVGEGVGLAMRRLSIIDVAHGHQPMSNEDNTVHVVYNGEVYNHRELRRELESRGHRFATDADTEVLVHGYEEWGRDGLLQRLRGMFAFAVWDDRRRALLLARDRMGIKPLYTALHDGRLYFASEISPILLHSRMPRRPNTTALDLFVRIGFATSPLTMFGGVEKIPPAHYLWVENGEVTRRCYWELSYDAIPGRSETDIVDEFRELLRECVDRHMMSEVPLGALLSGGVDSTTTAAFMSLASREPVTTVTVGFPDEDCDETDFAAESAREMGTRHHSIMFTGDTMRDYPTALRFREEPPARPAQAALYHVFGACREQGLKVVVTGEGADELLGGYDWHKSGSLDRFMSRLPLGLRGTLESFVPARALASAARRAVRSARGLPTKPHLRYESQINIARPRDAGRGLLSADAHASIRGGGAQSVIEAWSDWMSCVKGRPEFEQTLWIQSRTRMADYINHGLDRMSMAHSIEARPPFLDHTLWEFCASLPTGLKMRRATEKYLLREAGRGIVPEAARVRPKRPLGVPFHQWVAQKRLPDWAEESLSEAAIRRAGLFDPSAVSELRNGVQSGELRKASLLMGVTTMQTWSRIFIESPLDSLSHPPR